MTEVERIVTRAKRGRAAFVGVTALLCIAATFAVIDIGQESRITKVERSTCVKEPAGDLCQKSKRQSDRNRSIADTCIAFWKVGYPCPKPGTGRSIAATQGGDAFQPAPAGQSPPPAGGTEGAKPPKGGTPAPHEPGSHGPPAPPSPGASGEQSHPSPAPTAIAPPAPSLPPPAAPSSPEPEPETPGLLAPALTMVCSLADQLAYLC